MSEKSFTNEYPSIRRELDQSPEFVSLTPELIEQIVKFMQSDFQDNIFPLVPDLQNGEIPLEDCSKTPIIGYPGVFSLNYEGTMVGLYKETPEYNQ